MIKELKREDINLAEWEFEFQQRNEHPPLMADWWLCGMRDYFAAETKLPEWKPDYIITCEHKGYIKSTHKRAMLAGLRNKAQDRTYLHFIFERTHAMAENLNTAAESVMRELSPQSTPAELLRLWNTAEEEIHKAIPWFWAPYYLSEENTISDRVKNGLERYRGKIESVVDLDTALSLLVTPIKEPSFRREQRHFNALVAMAQRDAHFEESFEFKQEAATYLKQYAWMSTYFVVPLKPLSITELVLRVRAAAKNDTFEDFKRQEKEGQKRDGQVKQLEAAYLGDLPLEEAVADARELGWVLTASVEGALAATAKLIPLYERIAAELGVSYEQFALLTSADIRAGLNGPTRVSTHELDQRAEGYVACLQKGEITWVWGASAREFARELSAAGRAVVGEVSELTGKVAYKGKVTARACVAPTAAEANKMADGEILVTTMTTPDYVPAMKRAGAIVTDEGGLLCHAAIMSREFGKPCVIATKIATQVLKTGDVVEVDANKGIVKIVERA